MQLILAYGVMKAFNFIFPHIDKNYLDPINWYWPPLEITFLWMGLLLDLNSVSLVYSFIDLNKHCIILMIITLQ